jgi:hypothetical protein
MTKERKKEKKVSEKKSVSFPHKHNMMLPSTMTNMKLHVYMCMKLEGHKISENNKIKTKIFNYSCFGILN